MRRDVGGLPFQRVRGMDVGVEKAGFRTLVCVEADPNAVETLRENARRLDDPKRIVEADIRTVEPFSLGVGEVDLLHGGPPCQAFSLIGKRNSLADERGMLLFEMVRFAKVLAPRAVLVEQVKGLLSARDEHGARGGVFRRFTRELEKLGYTVSSAVLCAADYGVPQLRERVFIVALSNGMGFPFPAPTHSRDQIGAGGVQLARYVGIGGAIRGLPKPVPKGMVAKVANHIDVTPERDRERIHPVAEGGFLAGTPGAARELVGALTKKDTTKYRRLHRKAPSLTLRGGEIFFHPKEDRYLTPREYLRIHGYPDSHILCGPVRSRTGTVRTLDQHRLVANSVPAPLAEAIAREIAAALGRGA